MVRSLIFCCILLVTNICRAQESLTYKHYLKAVKACSKHLAISNGWSYNDEDIAALTESSWEGCHRNILVANRYIAECIAETSLHFRNSKRASGWCGCHIEVIRQVLRSHGVTIWPSQVIGIMPLEDYNSYYRYKLNEWIADRFYQLATHSSLDSASKTWKEGRAWRYDPDAADRAEEYLDNIHKYERWFNSKK